MTRSRTKPTNAFINALVKRAGFERLKDAAREKNVPYEGLVSMADNVGPNRFAVCYVETAEKFNVPIDVFMRGLAGKLTPEERQTFGLDFLEAC